MKQKKLSRKDIKHIAKLANLPLSESEIKKFQEQLSEVIEYINKLNEVHTENIEPVSQLTELINVFEKDGAQNKRSLTQAEAVKNAKEKKNGFIKIKAIF